MPKISVIIPVYNCEQYLRECLDSIIFQTMQDFEIIIMNDGSPDNSQEIIDEYVNKYPEKIKAFSQENKGQAAARNNALPYATGEFLIFVDSDDYIELDTFEKTYNYAKENDLDIVCFKWRDIIGEETKCQDWFIEDNASDVKYILNAPSPCNKIFKREIFVNNNIKFTESYIYEDLALIPTIALYTDKIGFMDDCFYNYIIHNDSTMRQKKYNKKLASIYFAMDYLKSVFESTKYTKELEFIYIEHLLHSATLRYLDYKEGTEDIKKISDIMRKEFPRWRKNCYYKKMGIKYKVFCELAYYKQVFLLKILLKKPI